MGTPTWRVVLLGAGLGVLVVALAVGWVVWQSMSSSAQRGPQPGAPVLVVLVMPDPDGVMLPRVIDEYVTEGAATSLRSLDPSMPATVAGTTAQTLAETYVFGGGNGVAGAVAHSEGAQPPQWVIVTPDALRTLVTSGSVTVNVPADMQVFDGTQLYSFSAGPQSVSLAVLPALFDGAPYLTRQQQADLRRQVGDALGSALASGTVTQESAFASSLRPAGLSAWVLGLGHIGRSQP